MSKSTILNVAIFTSIKAEHLYDYAIQVMQCLLRAGIKIIITDDQCDLIEKRELSGFDVEIVEKHHNQKLDAPSGTAIMLADSVNEAMNNQYTYVYDRSQVRQVRDKKELGISAVRAGSIVGDHDVIFAGKDEVITISHVAYSRAIFGNGAISAAKFLAGKEAGYYNMGHVISGQ